MFNNSQLQQRAIKGREQFDLTFHQLHKALDTGLRHLERVRNLNADHADYHTKHEVWKIVKFALSKFVNAADAPDSPNQGLVDIAMTLLEPTQPAPVNVKGAFGKGAGSRNRAAHDAAAAAAAAASSDVDMEAPRVAAPGAEAPRAEAPRVEAPRAEAPRAEAPRVETPRAEAPRAEAPRAEATDNEVLMEDAELSSVYQEFLNVCDARHRACIEILSKKVGNPHKDVQDICNEIDACWKIDDKLYAQLEASSEVLMQIAARAM